MKLEVEQIDMEKEEEVIVRCHDVEADWVGNVKDAVMGQLTVVAFFGRIIVFTLLGMATMVVYYSKDELTKGAWLGRTILHLLVLEAVFMPLAHHWKFWYGKLDAVIYASFIVLAKVLWHLIDYGIGARTASEINEKIRERRRTECGK